uniref:Putative (+)-epi-alpha-bisabolol synthase n=1 Tax=Scoparia dulcis TaxID=107240 RepID=A0A5K7XX18_SCODU|nr:putative (+)-epi-alpha-bisabolol synthase [Scoparia dulcis]
MSASDRRSANYFPNIWTDEYLQSLSSAYGEEMYLQRVEKLKLEVRNFLTEKTNGSLIDQIELVDILQRLGISHHFRDYQEKILQNVQAALISNGQDWNKEDNLHATALAFRLLRQDGHAISTDIFRNFMDEITGSFKASLCSDLTGLLSLYEASYLSMEGESLMYAAQVFATRHLREKLKEDKMDQDIAKEITHALEAPLRWSMPRLESRWFIDVYEKRQDMNPLLLELAKLDFNILQKMYQDELMQLSSWFSKSKLAKRLSFARDRVVECFSAAVGFTYEPYFSYSRMTITKFIVLLNIIDDIYDVYGTLVELELFTEVIKRWDINCLEQLPDYMKISFLALFNTVNEMTYDVLRDQEFNINSYAAETWAEVCEKYLVEARWYNSGYKPTLNEYLSNGGVSVACHLFVLLAYMCTTNPVEEKTLKDLQRHPEFIKSASLVSRLADDLATSSDELKRGDIPKSIQCYMHDTGCSEEDARSYIRNLMHSTWKSINKNVIMDHEYPKEIISIAENFARFTQWFYECGDGHRNPIEFKEQMFALFFEPIPLP